MFKEDKKPVNLVVVEACMVGGKHCEPDEVLEGIDAQTAADLVGSGRLRVAVPAKAKEPKGPPKDPPKDPA